MATPNQDEDRTRDMHRAIGRYVVEFSRLIFAMRSLLARRLADHDGKTVAAELALGQSNPVALADAFFAVCLEDGRLNADEKKIGRSLRARVVKEANEPRNDLSHGDWWIGVSPNPMISVEYPEHPSTGKGVLGRIKPAKETGAIAHHHLSAIFLDEWSANVAALSQLVTAFGSIAFGFDPEHRVRDVLAMENKQVVLRSHPAQPPPQSSRSAK